MYLASTRARIPSEPEKPPIDHLMSHLLDDTLRQLVYTRILGARIQTPESVLEVRCQRCNS